MGKKLVILPTALKSIQEILHFLLAKCVKNISIILG